MSTGLLIEVRNVDQYNAVAAASDSQAHFSDSSLVSFRKRAALRCKIGTLTKKNNVSQTIAITALIQRIIRQPSVSAMTPLIAGPTAPPTRGASMTRDIPEPRELDGNISPMMAGLSTFEATAKPVKKRAKMKSSAV
ncbi:hypothetical protein ACEPPN_010966 [Leptodophora sp. 'Broadleaf-Isolate-01']